jgi:SAM-dependent methyltransferase
MARLRSEIDWNGSAERYDAAEAEALRYGTVAAVMMQLAEIGKGMHVIDLACGTGTVTEHLLARYGENDVSVTAVDSSRAMLAAARRRLSSAVHFELANAEDLDRVIVRRTDRVLCSAAIWQMNMRRVFRAIRAVLRPGGRLLVSCPDDAVSIDGPNVLYGYNKAVWMVWEEQESRGYPHTFRGRSRVSQCDVVMAHALACGFQAMASERVVFRPSVTDTLNFIQIPACLAGLPLFDGIPDHDRTRTVGVVQAELEYVDAHVAPKQWRVVALEAAEA